MQKSYKTRIKEIFSSVQGEGPYVGEKHIFVRFCRCNLNCTYCDTDFSIQNSKEYSIDELFDSLCALDAETISFTGGEPLLETDFLINFLKKYKTKLNKKIYLETNGTLYEKLNEIIEFIDIVSMDIKQESASGQKNRFLENEKFLDIANKNNKEIFIKIVFDEKITKEEINKTIELAKKYNNLIILQPKMPLDKGLNIEKIFNMFFENYKNIRLIPQTHKFLNLL